VKGLFMKHWLMTMLLLTATPVVLAQAPAVPEPATPPSKAAKGTGSKTTVAKAETDGDCSKAPAHYKAMCEKNMRIKSPCPGLQGDELKACEQKAAHARKKQDCNTTPGVDKQRCEARNAAVDSPACAGKTGAEQKQCIRTEQAKLAPPRTASAAPISAPAPAPAPVPKGTATKTGTAKNAAPAQQWPAPAPGSAATKSAPADAAKTTK